MNLQITAKNIEVTPDLEGTIQTKLKEYSDYIDPFKTIQVKIEEVKFQYRLEVMFTYNNMFIKADVKEKSVKRALDRALDKIEQKINKIEYKQSIQFSKKLGKMMNCDTVDKDCLDESLKPTITRRKCFGIKPMNEEEALLQMGLLGHEFFMFFNGDVDSMCLLYKRKDGNYGMIESCG